MTKLVFPIRNCKRFPFFILFAVAWSVVAPAAGQGNVALRGKGVDARSNETVIGASVLLKGDKADSGTVTDINGLFSLNVPSLPATIVVSYIG